MTQATQNALNGWRHINERLLRGEGARNIPLQEMERIMIENFEASAHIDEGNPDAIAAFVKKLYKYYDNWLLSNNY